MYQNFLKSKGLFLNLKKTKENAVQLPLVFTIHQDIRKDLMIFFSQFSQFFLLHFAVDYNFFCFKLDG